MCKMKWRHTSQNRTPYKIFIFTLIGIRYNYTNVFPKILLKNLKTMEKLNNESNRMELNVNESKNYN